MRLKHQKKKGGLGKLFLNQIMHIRILLIATTLSCLIFVPVVLSQNSKTMSLGMMPTAETLGRGGYSTSIGMFRYEAKASTDEKSMEVGDFFQEEHRVDFEADTYLVPVKLTLGVSDYLDVTFGGTYSVGDSKKIVHDYYETDDTDKDKRVYPQFLFDGTIGLKYNIKPDIGDGLPSISVGGEIQTGYTADDKTNSSGIFVDDTPANSFPFFGMGMYAVASQDFHRPVLFTAHGSVGAFLSSKRPKITDSFKVVVQAGGELPVSEELYIIADFTTPVKVLSGVDVKSLLSVGIRFNITENVAFNIGLASTPGFQFNLFIGGGKAQPVAPQTPETGEEELMF